jgi:hypothetical protein
MKLNQDTWNRNKIHDANTRYMKLNQDMWSHKIRVYYFDIRTKPSGIYLVVESDFSLNFSSLPVLNEKLHDIIYVLIFQRHFVYSSKTFKKQSWITLDSNISRFYVSFKP